ncbi:MAG: DUF4388 domain-containing protein [Deltaproteobacteria bacterium]|nr:DUF4388 domain-containing protein [Deltaproteobacteria bacterium]
MDGRQDELVRIDATGTAHPVGRTASREMRQRQGALRLLPSPPQILVMRQTGDASLQSQFWLSGEITRPGVLWDLIGVAGQGKWDGELVVNDTDSRRSIFFERGAIIGASSGAERERLGEILYQYGALSERQVTAVAEAVTSEVRFGEAAVGLGYLSREKLFELIGRQVEEIVYATMLVSAGTFFFVDQIEESRLAYRLSLNVGALLMEGVRRMDEIELFRARVPSSLHVPEAVAGADLAEDHEHWAVFEVIDGSLTVDDIGRLLGMGQFDTTRAIFQLLQSRVIVLRPPRPDGAQAIVALFNQAVGLILQKVDAVGGGEEVRGQLASFATASGVYDQLFGDAGPAADGTLDADKIAEHIELLVGGGNAVAMLGQWLFEYASFAMFIAEPLLRSRSMGDGSTPPPSAAVSKAVSELLAPLAPES